MPNLEVDQELPYFGPFEHGLSESAEGVETNLAPSHPSQNGLETVTAKIAGGEHGAPFRFKQESTLPIADILPKHRRNERMNVHVTITGISFRCRNNFTLADSAGQTSPIPGRSRLHSINSPHR